MLHLILGRLDEHNRYHISEIEKNYIPMFTRSYPSIGGLLVDTNNIRKPILGGKILMKTYLKMKTKDLPGFIRKIEHLSNNQNFDILIIIETVGLITVENSEDTPNIRIINLLKSTYEDFVKYVTDRVPIDEKGVKAVIKAIGFSTSKFQLYEEDLKNLFLQKTAPLNNRDIYKVIKERKIKPVEEVLYDVIIYSDLTEHYKLCDKYSKKWVFNTYKNILTKVFEAKKELNKGGLKYSEFKLQNAKLVPFLELDFFHIHLLNKLLQNQLLFESTMTLAKSERNKYQLTQKLFKTMEVEDLFQL